MELSLADLRLLIEAVGTLESEYGERPETTDLMERLRAVRRRREEGQ
jgi:hypothetical protein